MNDAVFSATSTATAKRDPFSSTERYIADPALEQTVNAAIALQRPLLVKGEPGTGKTMLAVEVAETLGLKLIRWQVKSSTRAADGLYVYDTVQRLHDSRFGAGDVSDIRHYIRFGPLGEAFRAEERVVLLIDEVDKADIEFPNDLLHELDAMAFDILETGDHVVAQQRPIVIITSNNEKELPDAFLRRCVFHYIEFPAPDLMRQIVLLHHPDLERKIMEDCLATFYALRNVATLRKKPATSELIDWIATLKQFGVDVTPLAQKVPFLGTLIKNEYDLHAVRSALGRR